MYLYFPIVDVNDYSLYSDVMKFGVGWLALLSTFRITVDGVDNLIDLFSNRTFFLLFVFIIPGSPAGRSTCPRRLTLAEAPRIFSPLLRGLVVRFLVASKINVAVTTAINYLL